MRKETPLKALLLAGLAIGHPAFAAEAQPAAAEQSPEPTGLGDIVVTAQRRSESLQRAAIAVSAATGETLIKAGVTQPSQLTSVIPALQVAPAAGPYSLFYLRGVGNFNGNALSDSAIAFNFDGVYVGRPSATTGFFYDLDRVEVLKGPQGTLYGRNATGGAINVISNRAKLGQTSGSVGAEYGNYNAVRLDGALNLPLGQSVALRAAGVYVKHDGYMKDGTDSQDDLGGRLSLRADPAPNLTIDVVADYFRQRGVGGGATPVELGVDGRQGLFSPAGQAFYAANPNTLLGRTFAPLTDKPYLHNDYWGISSTIEWKTEAGTFTLIPAYRESKLDFRSSSPGFQIQSREQDKQTSFEARYASDETRPLRVLAGAFLYDETNSVPMFYVNQQSNINLLNYNQNIKSMATFGRLTYAVVPNVRFNVGARYTTEDKRLDGILQAAIRTCVRPTAYFPTYVPGCASASPFAFQPGVVPAPNFNPLVDGTLTIPSTVNNSGTAAKHASFERVTWRAGADWDITSHNLVYASYETGFKSGGFFFTADSGVYQPEKIEAWTLGSKNRFADGRVQINLEAFHWRYRDQQITHLLLDSFGNSIFGTENVGRATFKGIEIESRFLVTPNTQISADAQYLDARYDDFIYLTPNRNGGISNGTGCANAAAPGVNYTIDCSGKRPPNAPEWTINLGAEQTIPLGNGAKIVVDGRGHYQTTTLTGLEFTNAEYQSAYWLVDGQVAYHAPDDRFTIAAYINNAFDKTVISNTFPTPFSFFNATSLRPPRTFGVRASANF